VPERDLDLLHGRLAGVRPLGERTAKIVRHKIRHLDIMRVFLHAGPDRIWVHRPATDPAGAVERPNQCALGHDARFHPRIDSLTAADHRDGADAAALAGDIDNHPAAFRWLDVFQGQRCELRPAQATADQQGRKLAASTTTIRLAAIRKLAAEAGPELIPGFLKREASVNMYYHSLFFRKPTRILNPL